MTKKKKRAASPMRQPSPLPTPDVRSYGWTPSWSGTTGRNQDIARGDNGAALTYGLVPLVKRCITLKADAINALDWEIVAGEGDDERVIASSQDRRPKHPFARAMQDVYKHQKVPFFTLITSDRDLFGEVYIQLERNSFHYPRGLRWLNPLVTEPVIISGRIDGYRYREMYGGASATLPPECVAFDKTHNPHDDLRGLSAVDVALDEINISRNLKRAVRAFFRNNGRPGLVVSPDSAANFSERDITNIKQQISDFHLGVNNQHTTLVAPIKANFEAMELPDIQKQYSINLDIQREICVALGVPLAMAGDSSSSTFKDSDEIRKVFNQNTIKPLASTIEDFINVSILPFFDEVSQYPDAVFRFDLSAFEDDVLPAERALAELIDLRVKGGYLSLADGARAQGLTPDPILEDLYIIGGVPVPKAALPTYWERTLPPSPAPPFAASVTPPETPLLSIETPPDPPVPQLTASVTPDTSSLSIVLALPNDVELVALQRDLESKFTTPSITWNAPDTFHVTLIAAPLVDDALCEALVAQLSAIPVPDLQLNIGSLATFDSLNEHALHFRIRHNADLEDYQERLYALCETLGIQTRQYSRPDDWKPHITMGYSPTRIPVVTYSSRLRVAPTEVQVSVKRENGYEVIGRVACGEAARAIDPASLFPKPLPYAEWQKAAREELAAWQRHIKQGKTRAFEPVHTRGLIAETVTAALAANAPLAGVFDTAFESVRRSAFEATQAQIERVLLADDTTRDYAATRDDFETQMLDLIIKGYDDELTRSRFVGALHRLIERLGKQAYLDGLTDGGIVDPELDDEDTVAIATLTKEHKGYATAFGAAFWKETYSQAQLVQRPLMWANGTLAAFYYEGLGSANKNVLLEWRRGPTSDGCETCRRLEGQKHRAKQWIKSGYLPKSLGHKALSCGGWQCLCELVPTRGRAYGNF